MTVWEAEMVRQCKTEEKQRSPGRNTQLEDIHSWSYRHCTGLAARQTERAASEAQPAGQDWMRQETQQTKQDTTRQTAE